MDGDRGRVYSAAKTYDGEMLLDRKFLFHGMGSLRNESNGSVFYGHFDRGRIDGVGLLCFENGKVFPAVFERKKKKFKMADPDTLTNGALDGVLRADMAMTLAATSISDTESGLEREQKIGNEDVNENMNDGDSDSADSKNTEKRESEKRRRRVKGHE